MDFSEALSKMIGLANGSNDQMALNAVMEVQRQLIEIQEENRKLREENNDLKNLDITSSELEFTKNFYLKRGTNEGPYCSFCWDKDKRLIRLHAYADTTFYSDSTWVNLYCGVCGKKIQPGVTLEDGEAATDGLRRFLEAENYPNSIGG